MNVNLFEQEHVMVYGRMVDRLRLQNAELQSDPCNCALKLLGCLFSPEELVNGNPSGITNSSKEAWKKSIQKPDPARMKYLRGMYSIKIVHTAFTYNDVSVTAIVFYSVQIMLRKPGQEASKSTQS